MTEQNRLPEGAQSAACYIYCWCIYSLIKSTHNALLTCADGYGSIYSAMKSTHNALYVMSSAQQGAVSNYLCVYIYIYIYICTEQDTACIYVCVQQDTT